MFDPNEENRVDEPQKEQSEASKDYKRIDRKNSIGRIESGERKNEARIVHQYPRDGNFRFPLIPDESYKSGRKVENKSNDNQHKVVNDDKWKTKNKTDKSHSEKQAISKANVSNKTNEPKEQESSKKFSGINFKPTDIPSPIYGFSKRPVAEKVEKALQDSDNTKKYTPLDEHKVIDQLIHKPVDYSSEEQEIHYNYSSIFKDNSDENKPEDKLQSSEEREEVPKVEQPNEISESVSDSNQPLEEEEDTVKEIETIASSTQTNKEQELDEHQHINANEVKEKEEEKESLSFINSILEDAVENEDETQEIEDQESKDQEYEEYPQPIGVLAEEQEEQSDNDDIGSVNDLTESTVSEDELQASAEEEESTSTFEEQGDIVEEENNLILEDSITAEETNSMNSEKRDSEGNEETTEEPSEVVQNERKKNEAPKKRDDTKGERKREEGRPKPQVPYNVMMLASDRRHLVKKPVSNGEYKLPPISLLDIPPRNEGNDDQWLEEQRELLESTLKNFNVQATVIGATMGPTVTRFEVQPSPGVKVNKITNLSDDIKLSLAARDIRMEAPIPGRNAIGIEVPNPTSRPVFIREIVRSGVFQSKDAVLNAALGFDIGGNAKVTDIQKMPHGLIAGATGSGKSVCINSILVSLLLNSNPSDVKMLLIDPKMVELAPYNGLPHLVTPVINDVKEATTALKWAVDEMEERYEKFAAAGVRDIKRYNDRAIEHGEPQHKLPYIVVVIDELADLMMVSPQDVEDAICRIAQKARACGIHLLVATQRPSVDVITGLIKANIPTRIAFSVSSQIDSRTILDTGGAEKLLGRGDMLCLENGSSKPIRLQGNFVSDEEIERVTSYVRKQRKPNYLIAKEDLAKKQQYNEQEDDLFEEACMWAIEQGQASSSALQRRFRIGFNRAARLIEMMEERGLVSEAMGSKPRSILMSKTDFEETFLKDMHV